MRLSSFTTCNDKKGKVVGVQFAVKQKYKDEIALAHIGTINEKVATCRNLVLEDGGIDSIKASFDEDDEIVNAIYYYKDGKTLKYGKIDSKENTEWTFSDEKPMIGLYGFQ